MKDYRNMRCAACDVIFDDESDIVVCPVCGAPHHRECWNASGHCACESQHSENYTWKPENTAANENTGFESDDQNVGSNEHDEKIICPVCGRETSKSEDYCERCGYYLAHSRDGAYGGVNGQINFNGFFDFNEAEQINGVPAGDIKRFVGNMWMYYIPKFINFVKKKTSVSFNFTSFLTNGLWFVSRKMYGVGIALITVMLGISAYQAYFYEWFNSTLGSTAKTITLIQLLRDNEILFVGLMVYYFLSFVRCTIMLLCGLFGNKLYMNFCTKKIKRVNAQATAAHASPEQFNEMLETGGGIAVPHTISAGLCYFAVLLALDSGLFF